MKKHSFEPYSRMTGAWPDSISFRFSERLRNAWEMSLHSEELSDNAEISLDPERRSVTVELSLDPERLNAPSVSFELSFDEVRLNAPNVVSFDDMMFPEYKHTTVLGE